MEPFFEKYLAERDRNPTRDLLTVLQQARRDGQISSETVHALLSAVLTAGNETTRNTINGAIVLLSEHPDQMRLLAAQPNLVKTATEEFLRYLSPVRGFGRTVLQDVEVRAGRSRPVSAYSIFSCPATVTRTYSQHQKYSTWLDRATKETWASASGSISASERPWRAWRSPFCSRSSCPASAK
jgi:Cytochrome P450